jgi:hypothetical protein
MVGTGGGQPVEGLPFTERVVDRLLSSEPMVHPAPSALRSRGGSRGTILGL